MKRRVTFLLLSLLAAGLAAPVSAKSTLLVHLPSAPIEAASRLAETAAALSSYLAEQLELELELQLFRRRDDADRYLASNGDEVVLLLTDASFLLDLGEGAGFEPRYRLMRSGKGTYRRVLVVRASAENVHKLKDLEGSSLQVVETSGSSGTAFLERVIFEGEIELARWFGRIETVVDDFAAANAVLYGQTPAALVAEHNPLVQGELARGLRSVYTSPPISLPVVAVRSASFTADLREELDRAFANLGDDPRGRKFLDELKLDGMETLVSDAAKALLSFPKRPGKELEIALPAAGIPTFELPPLPSADQLPFTLTVELPDIALPRENDPRD